MSRAAPWVLLSAAALMWAATCSMAPRDDGEAARYLRAAEVFAAERDSIARENAALTVAYADSTAAWERRTTEARAARAEADARAQRATRRADEVATDLVARLDSAEAAMFAEYDQARDSIEAAMSDAIEAVTVQLATVTADRDATRALLLGVTAERDLLLLEVAELRPAVEALQARIRDLEPTGFGRIVDGAEKVLAAKALIDFARPS